MTAWLAGALVAVVVAGGSWLQPIRRLGAHSDLTAPASLRSVLALAVGSLVVALHLGPVLVLVAVAGAGGVIVVRRRAARSRVVAGRRRAVVELTYAIAADLRAGRSVAEALRAAAEADLARAGPAPDPELRAAMQRAGAAAARGESGADVIRDAAALEGAERLRQLAGALQIADSTGARVATVLDGLGAAMDHDEELRQELDAALAGPRASMVMLAVLPVFGLVLGQGMGADPAGLLVHRPVGWGLLGGGVILDAAGVGLVRLITRSVLRC